MLQNLSNWIKDSWSYILHCFTLGIGEMVQTVGITIEQFAVIIIMLGILLWFFRITRVFRIGLVSYFVGMIINLLGILIAA